MKYFGANPIYDTVFKYLMEDQRVAATILSALLKKKVVAVSQRAHEHTNVTKKDVTMFRIDFSAVVRDNDGKEEQILIELQKTWVETETLRFRQYLGAQYNKQENVVGKGAEQHALPMVAVYILGHRVGEVDEPVLYVSHKSYDYYGNEVESGMKDPFVSSLTHDSIIVQIPLLHGRVNPNLEKVLFCFDQTNRWPDDNHIIAVDESLLTGNPEMEYIMRRLASAAADPDVRQDMNVEDEYFSALEARDTTLMILNHKIEEKDAQLEQKAAQLEQKDAQLEQKDAQLEQKDAQLEQKDAQLEQKAAQLEEKDAQLEQRAAQLEQKDAQLEQKDKALMATVKALKDAGMSSVQIAQMTGLDVGYIDTI